MFYPGMSSNFTVPMNHRIPNGRLSMGNSIFISGRSTPYADRFAVNLLLPNGDIALHLNPRFNDGCVVRNTKRYGNWETEDRYGGLPFGRGQPFQINIVCQPDGYAVTVNGRDFCRFGHRLPMEQVGNIEITGDVQIENFYVSGGQMYGGAPQPLYNPPVPVYYNVPGGMFPGRMLIITGLVRQGGEGRFSVNLQQGQHGNVIAFHLDVRMHYGDSHRVVVRNSQINGQWGSEERHLPYFPFEYNAQFTIYILCEAHQFKVAVNNQHLLEFRHRFNQLQAIDTVNVSGDCQLMELRVQ